MFKSFWASVTSENAFKCSTIFRSSLPLSLRKALSFRRIHESYRPRTRGSTYVFTTLNSTTNSPCGKVAREIYMNEHCADVLEDG
ncbi:hypothetical protein FA13DRAFT_660902 [Coprinellus micaceus]|uniref:Uncharacterized protein n=1 Tax=Coprinellus micaceus TaxID=71717 RepID=A0A4Y7S9P0_COPMI|nr:hypothetical protein FA13DRAFT_660902 [Coprinellus micaceus]